MNQVFWWTILFFFMGNLLGAVSIPHDIRAMAGGSLALMIWSVSKRYEPVSTPPGGARGPRTPSA